MCRDVDLLVTFETSPGNLAAQRRMVVVPRVGEHIQLVDDVDVELYKIMSVSHMIEAHRLYVNEVFCAVEAVG